MRSYIPSIPFYFLIENRSRRRLEEMCGCGNNIKSQIKNVYREGPGRNLIIWGLVTDLQNNPNCYHGVFPCLEKWIKRPLPTRRSNRNRCWRSLAVLKYPETLKWFETPKWMNVFLVFCRIPRIPIEACAPPGGGPTPFWCAPRERRRLRRPSPNLARVHRAREARFKRALCSFSSAMQWILDVEGYLILFSVQYYFRKLVFG